MKVPAAFRLTIIALAFAAPDALAHGATGVGAGRLAGAVVGR